jgi:2-oxoacid:acceptor oxidoreductase gamma subunit (pyruvate/2-ketoisovalerate family)
VVGFLRVDEEPILLKCQIYHPDHMIIFDFSLIDEKELLQELKPKGTLLINTHQGIDSFRKLRKFKIGLVDAGPIARSLGLGATFNTAMLGAYVRLTNLITLKTLAETVKVMAPAKKEENVEAVREAYNQVKIYGAEEEAE